MTRVCGVCVLAVLVGCGGSDGKKKLDAGQSDAADAAKDVAADLQIESSAGADVAADTIAQMDTAPETAEPDASDAPADAADGGADAADDMAGDAGADAAGDAAAEVAAAKLITVGFTGEVVTVATAADGGMPLGFDKTVRTEKVSGSFSYDLAFVDDVLALDRGKYERYGKSAFTFTVKGHTVTGSGNAILQTENLTSSDTFRFIDGPQGDAALRRMKLDGVDAPTLKLFIAISDSSAAMLTSDKLPDPFPTVDIKNTPHTFSLQDSGGTLLMQLDTLVNQ